MSKLQNNVVLSAYIKMLKKYDVSVQLHLLELVTFNIVDRYCNVFPIG